MLSQRDALYRAVCEFPDEDTPRLAFADLLEEDGDPGHAAFVRLQVELARAPEYDPLWAKCRHLHPDAERGWMRLHTLPKPLPAGFSWRSFAFRRGFPWLCAARGDALTGGAALFATAPVQALSYNGQDGRPDPAALAACPHLARLRRLEFSLTHYDAEDAARLGNSPHAAALTELAFAHNALRPDGLRGLAESPLFARLTALELMSNVIPPALLTDALAAADAPGALRSLSLAHSELSHHDAAHLFALPVIRALDQLDLGGNPDLGPAGAEALAEAGAVRGLTALKLSYTLPGVPGVKALAQTSALGGVRWLDLSENRLGPVAVRALAGSRHARGLRVLDLSDNPLGDAGAAALAASPHLSGLVELVLRDCDVRDAGALALAESPHLDGLVRLDVRSPGRRPLGAAARRALAARFDGRVSYNHG